MRVGSFLQDWQWGLWTELPQVPEAAHPILPSPAEDPPPAESCPWLLQPLGLLQDSQKFQNTGPLAPGPTKGTQYLLLSQSLIFTVVALGELAPWSGSFRLKEGYKIWFCCWTPRPTSPFSPSLYCYTESLQLHSQMPWPIKPSFFLMRKLRLTEVKGHVLRGHPPWGLYEEDRGRKYQYLLSILHLIWSDSSQGRQDYFHLTDENAEAQWVTCPE